MCSVFSSFLLGVRGVEKNLCIPGSSPILIKNARLICLPPRGTDILPWAVVCVILSAICLNINNSHFHTWSFLQFVKMVAYSSKLISLSNEHLSIYRETDRQTDSRHRQRETAQGCKSKLAHHLSTKDYFINCIRI